MGFGFSGSEALGRCAGMSLCRQWSNHNHQASCTLRSQNLNSLNWGHRRDILWTAIGAITGETRSLEFCSYGICSSTWDRTVCYGSRGSLKSARVGRIG